VEGWEISVEAARPEHNGVTTRKGKRTKRKSERRIEGIGKGRVVS